MPYEKRIRPQAPSTSGGPQGKCGIQSLALGLYSLCGLTCLPHSPPPATPSCHILVGSSAAMKSFLSPLEWVCILPGQSPSQGVSLPLNLVCRETREGLVGWGTRAGLWESLTGLRGSTGATLSYSIICPELDDILPLYLETGLGGFQEGCHGST